MSVQPAAPWHEAQVSELYQQHREELLRFVRRRATRCGVPDSRLDAEGVVHEAYLAMLRYWSTVRNPRAWLYAVAGRLVGRAAIENCRYAADDPDWLTDLGAAHWTSLPPRISVEEAAEARAVLRSIGDLPGRQGVVTYLHCVEGWSHAEIADQLGTAPGASRVTLFRGIQRLKAQWPKAVSDHRRGARRSPLRAIVARIRRLFR
jgi:RNA polymerase sigma-70 factor (ECF subfamily)